MPNGKQQKKHNFHLFIRLSGQITKSHRYPKSIGTSGNARGDARKDRCRSERAGVGLHGKASRWKVCTDILDFNGKNKPNYHCIKPFVPNVSKD